MIHRILQTDNLKQETILLHNKRLKLSKIRYQMEQIHNVTLELNRHQ